jgi:hypothetical protein
MTVPKIQFSILGNASLTAEWFFFIIGVIFLIISVFGNGYVSYRLIKIVRVSKAIQVSTKNRIIRFKDFQNSESFLIRHYGDNFT